MTSSRQYHLPLPVREALGADDFLVTSANEAAALWLLSRSASSWPAHALLLWGPEGTGKTHLLTAWAAREGAVRVLPGDEALLAELAGGTAPARAFALDEADAVVGDPQREEWLQHLFNATKASGAPLLLTAQRPAAAWGLGLRDIETRLKSCPSVELCAPDDELMRGLLLKLFADRQLMVEAGVVDFLAARLERTGGAVRAAVAALDEAALQAGRKISVPFAQKILMQNEPEPEHDQDENAQRDPV